MLSKILKWRPTPSGAPASTVYLVKDSDDLISWCKCPIALASAPGQLDCPWCGCGWLFSCVTCRKAFTFARGVVVDRTLESIGADDLHGMGGKWGDDALHDWVISMSELLKGVEPGQRYVYLDGWFLPADRSPPRLDGWYARHQLAEAPQISALRDRSFLDSTVGSRGYWVANALPQQQQ